LPVLTKMLVMYHVRYGVLKAAKTIRNVAALIAFLAGSYLASGLINASPVTQPNLRIVRPAAVIVAPATMPEAAEVPPPALQTPFAAPPDATLTL
jgi:hypothetical protein